MKFVGLYLALCGLGWAAVAPAKGTRLPTVIPTIAALASLSSDRVDNGAYAVVAGYYAPNDGGGGIFLYDASSSARIDSGSTFAWKNGPGRWLRLANGPIDVRQFGAKGDGTTDDTRPIQTAIDYAAGVSERLPGAEVFFPAGFTGKTTGTLRIPSGLSGFSLVGAAPQDDPRAAQIQYHGPANRPILIFCYSFVGHAGFQLAADAAIAGSQGASAIIQPSSADYLAPGASESGNLGAIHGTLSNRWGQYRFTRDSGGVGSAWVGNLDCFVPDSARKPSTVTRDRAGILRNLSFSGDQNATGVLFQGHGSGELLENVRVQNVYTAVQITQPPSAGNDEFITFQRCNLSGYQCGLWIANGDSYAITVESCSIGLDPSITPAGRRAAIRVLSPDRWSPGQNGAGLNVYGGNIGTSNDRLPNNAAALEVSGAGDPISFNGVRSECVGTAVRLLNSAGSGRSIHFQSCSFSMNPRALPPFLPATHLDRGIFFSCQGRTYRVVAAGVSGLSGPTSNDKTPEVNGSTSVVYIARTGAQDDYASFSYIVEAGNYLSGDAYYSQSPGEHESVTFDSTTFGLNLTAAGGLAVDGAEYLSLRYNQCIFSGRLFECTSSNQPLILKNQCSFNPWPSIPQFIYDDSEVGAPVNLLRCNSDPANPAWTVGPQATTTRDQSSGEAPYLPIMGGNGFRIGVTGAGRIYDTPATMISQETSIAANRETGNDFYVLNGSVPFYNAGRNGAVVVSVTDADGYILAKGIYSGGSRFSLPFAAGNPRLRGQVRLWIGAMDVSNAHVGASLAMLQIGRNRDHTYVQTADFPIDGLSLLQRDELFHGIVSAGRLIVPSSRQGGVPSGPYDLRDGDIRVDGERRLSIFDGVAWEAHPRTFYQPGLNPPTSGIWRVGDQLLNESPASGSFIGLVCIRAGAFPQPGGFAPADYGPWAANSFVRLSSYRYTPSGNIYKCVKEGTSSSVAPAGTSGFVPDGGIWWEPVGRIGPPVFRTFGPIS